MFTKVSQLPEDRKSMPSQGASQGAHLLFLAIPPLDLASLTESTAAFHLSSGILAYTRISLEALELLESKRASALRARGRCYEAVSREATLPRSQRIRKPLLSKSVLEKSQHLLIQMNPSFS